MEIGVGLRARGAVAGRLAVTVQHSDGREGAARSSLDVPTAAERALQERAIILVERATARRVRVRRIRVEAWEAERVAIQLSLWEGMVPAHTPDRDASLESALDRVRTRFGTAALVPAAWMVHGLVVRPRPRP